MEFETTKEMVAELVQRVSAPFSMYNYEVIQDDENIEILVKQENVSTFIEGELLTSVTINPEYIQAVKVDLTVSNELDTIPYHDYLNLFDYVVTYIYRMIVLKKAVRFEEFLTAVLNKDIRTWMDFIVCVLKANEIEYVHPTNSSVKFWDYTLVKEGDLISLEGSFSVSIEAAGAVNLFHVIILMLTQISQYQGEELFIFPPELEDIEMNEMEDGAEGGDVDMSGDDIMLDEFPDEDSTGVEEVEF